MEQGRTIFHRIKAVSVGLALLWAVGLLSLSTDASALDLRFPGSFYSEFRYPNSPVEGERGNNALDGSFEQGIDWLNINERLTLNTFGEFRYNLDTEGLDYNNRVIPGIGAKFKLRIGHNGMAQFGVKGVYEHRFKSGRTNTIIMGFVNCWFGWELGGR